MTEKMKTNNAPVKNWDQEKRNSVMNEFLEDVIEHIDNMLLISDDVKEMLTDDYKVCLIIKKDGTDTFFSREEV